MSIRPYINERFDGVIWRMEIDELSETLCVEVRNNEEKKVHFASLDLSNGETFFNSLATPERWLTGIETVYNGVLLLHFYQSETGPTHKGLLAIDAVTGKTLWSNFSWAFDHLTINGPAVYDTKIQPRKLFLIDVKTGATIRGYEPSVDLESKNSVALPEIKTSDFSDLNQLSTLVAGNMIHYLEYNNLRIVSLHALNEGQLTQLLYVMKDDNVIYEDLLNSGIQKIQPEAFIIHKNHLIYIKDKSALKVLAL